MKWILAVLLVAGSVQAGELTTDGVIVPDLSCKVYNDSGYKVLKTKEMFSYKHSQNGKFVYIHEDKENKLLVQMIIDQSTLSGSQYFMMGDEPATTNKVNCN
ncbi:TPA: hypothetical protein RCG93_003016 [Enterobacter roggenkampii]|uniref:hypothetical protein n=1 Tax=Enterobacter cloacae complex TaxID=354276 RepID=UPI000793BB4C|nr:MULTISPECIES: hypothetical protein [Enterobacter cloacae complex]MCQ4399824.1 hypothetical protein [Enterobacter cloacae]MCR2770102.1 hypothetical protein [Enterobacter kobei]URE96801.1 hypothetical protein LK774_08370 [Enterobacter kobei]SAE50750.1 Uncharacterised protein [Enterobacter roggenkampii]BBV90940.1 hypothetical protein STW0522ENT66_13670 [Enterobacter roggenkampii]